MIVGGHSPYGKCPGAPEGSGSHVAATPWHDYPVECIARQTFVSTSSRAAKGVAKERQGLTLPLFSRLFAQNRSTMVRRDGS